MCDRVDMKKISKRRFLKQCLFGMTGMTIGFKYFGSVAESAVFHQPAGRGNNETDKWSKEALYYSKTSHGVRCFKCPHGCNLGEGETGRCRNRVCQNGKLYTIAYGNPCAVHIDPIEKKPFNHFLPSTRAFSIAVAGCNLRCLNCQNWQISQVSPHETLNDDLSPEAVVEQCLSTGCESIAYTYSEPITFYEYVLDTAKVAREKNIRNVFKSNGYINELPLRRLCKSLDAANIDLKSYSEEIYAKLSEGALAPVLRTLKVLREEGVWLEITNLVIPSWTDDRDMIKRMCEWLCANGLQDSPLHFSRFTPLYKLTQLPLTPVATLENAREIALQAGVRYVYIGNVPHHEAENTFCHKCRKMIIERRGFSVLQNFVKKGRCQFCQEKIPGVWL
jgi:pyruvate formate lyase activating enzyme